MQYFQTEADNLLCVLLKYTVWPKVSGHPHPHFGQQRVREDVRAVNVYVGHNSASTLCNQWQTRSHEANLYQSYVLMHMCTQHMETE